MAAVAFLGTDYPDRGHSRVEPALDRNTRDSGAEFGESEHENEVCTDPGQEIST